MRKLIGCHLCPVKLIMSNKKNLFIVLIKAFLQKNFFLHISQPHLMYVKKFPFEQQFD